jgi:FAD/FMN-containing dehydrogenase
MTVCSPATAPSSPIMHAEAYQSWGRYPYAHPRSVTKPHWRDEVSATLQQAPPVLAYGLGRSYGDVCLNNGGHVIDMSALDRIIAFDRQSGRIRCEAGGSLAALLAITVPFGWFLPVTPGTKFVTVGGAIANDVHGKNHHYAGTFGCHVTSLELARSDGNIYSCSCNENSELFAATIGGLGLTGIVLSAELQLRPIASCSLEVENIPFRGLPEFLHITSESDAAGWEYTVAWIDCLARVPRGIFLRANHIQGPSGERKTAPGTKLQVPFCLPDLTLNPLTIRAFNCLYYWTNRRRKKTQTHYEPFFYPLDAVGHWNRVYGSHGPLQYQCVIPEENSHGFVEILASIARHQEGSFLGIIKRFGARRSPGLLSFPRPGLTLALDFRFSGQRTLRLFEELDRIVLENYGAMYPAKDMHMSPELFRASYPRLEHFRRFLDPKLSSTFWRRVNA